MAGRDHCVVIGAGVVGACCAWFAVRAGLSVTLIDSEDPGQSTSFGNAGCLSTTQVFPFSWPGVIRQVPGWLFTEDGPLKLRWAHTPQLAPWLWRFLRAGRADRVEQIVAAQYALMAPVRGDFDLLLDAAGLQDFRDDRGTITVYDKASDAEGDAWKQRFREQYELPQQALTPAELHDLEPDLRLPAGGLAFFDPEWQHVNDPGGLTAAIAQSAIAGGARWLNDRVASVSVNGGGVRLRTETGHDVDADRLVIAAGVWSDRLTRQLGLRVPLAAKRGYHSMVADSGVRLNRPVTAGSRMFVMSSMRGGLRVAGTAEFARIDTAPDYRRADVLLRHMQDYLPNMRSEGLSQWMGQRPMTPDSLPMIGPIPGEPRVLLATGHGHYGLTQGPTTGRMIGRLLSGRDAGLDLAPYAPGRF